MSMSPPELYSRMACSGCRSAGSATYSSVWVGLGGYAQTSRALEQIGTEADCSAAGQATYSAWFEVVQL